MVRLLEHGWQHPDGPVLLTQADLSLLLGLTTVEVSTLLQAARQATGKPLLTKGYFFDQGMRPTHKAEIIALYERGMDEADIARTRTIFYMGQHGKQKGLEFHGDLGSLYLSSFQDFHAEVELAGYDEAYAPVPLVRPAFQGVDWGRSVAEIADAIAEDRPQRATGAQAAHVVEVCAAISQSLQTGRLVAVASSFASPWPMDRGAVGKSPQADWVEATFWASLTFFWLYGKLLLSAGARHLCVYQSTHSRFFTNGRQTMCCAFLVLVFIGLRFFGAMWWLFQPTRRQLAFSDFFGGGLLSLLQTRSA